MNKVNLSAAVAAWRAQQDPTVAELEANPVTQGLPLVEAVQAHIDSLQPHVPAKVLFVAFYTSGIAALVQQIEALDDGAKLLRKVKGIGEQHPATAEGVAKLENVYNTLADIAGENGLRHPKAKKAKKEKEVPVEDKKLKKAKRLAEKLAAKRDESDAE